MRAYRASYFAKQTVIGNLHRSFHSRHKHPSATEMSMQQIRSNQTILVYDGEGAGSRSVLSTVESLSSTLSPQVQVAQLGPEELLAGEWQDGCLMLVMPGGADLPYCRQLNGRGNCLIRGFVEAGGAYLGLCAGAYYACCFVEFALGTRLEVRGPRELAFFPGVAAGPVYPGFRYESEAGAHAARVTFRPPQPLSFITTSGQRSAAVETPAAYGTSTAASAEMSKETPSTGQRTFVEGGSSVAAGAPRWHQGLPSSSESTYPAGWITCRDYTNGGPQFVPSAETTADSSGLEPAERHLGVDYLRSECSNAKFAYEVLAVYPDKRNGLAAVKCNIGAGVAILVGTHPELDTKWLQAEPERVPAVEEALKPHSASAPQSSSTDGLSVQKSSRDGEMSVGGVREQLERSKAERHLFWTMLLQSAGLGSYILDTK